MDSCIQIIIENLKFQCRNPISVNFIAVTPKTDFSQELVKYKGNGHYHDLCECNH